MAKVLVTGANGFLASYIIRNLLESDNQVFGMLRPNADKRNLEGLEFTLIYGAITNPDDVETAVRGIDVIIHAAADTNPSHPSMNDYLNPNVYASRILLKAAIRNHCKRIIYVSTANTVGYGNLAEPGTEKNTISPVFKKHGYAYSKWLAEKMFSDESTRGVIDVVICNPVFMIGYNATGGSSMKIFQLYFSKGPLFYTGGGKNFIYIDDAAKAICNAIKSGRNGERYLLGNENLSYKEFFHKIDLHQRERKVKVKLPDYLILGLGYIGNVLNLFRIEVPVNKANANILIIRSCYSSLKAISELGLPQTDIDTAIKLTLDRMKDH